MFWTLYIPIALFVYTNAMICREYFDSQEYDPTLEDCSFIEEEESKLEHLSEKKDGKKYHALASLAGENPAFAYMPAVQTQPKYCSCGREKKFVDLGLNYFPRYVVDMVCLPGGCANYACRPKRYRLWVMRKRRVTDIEPSTEPIPNELRNDWIAESVITTVDCECRP